MQEVKTPKKPFIFYYLIAMIVLLCLNFLLLPAITEHQIKEVDYGTFMKMMKEKEIGKVMVEDNQIVFTDKQEENVYKTGVMYDPNLVENLYESGAKFSS